MTKRSLSRGRVWYGDLLGALPRSSSPVCRRRRRGGTKPDDHPVILALVLALHCMIVPLGIF